MSHGQHADHRALLNRVRRLEGQVRGVGKMIERADYCVDILHQLRAVARAARSLEVLIMEEHVSHCLKGTLASRDEAELRRKSEELVELFKSSLR